MKTAEEIGRQILATLRKQAIRNRQAADAMREQIRAVLARHGEPAQLSAYEVRSQLRIVPLPSLRTIQDHLKIIRAALSVSRIALLQDDAHGS